MCCAADYATLGYAVSNTSVVSWTTFKLGIILVIRSEGTIEEENVWYERLFAIRTLCV